MSAIQSSTGSHVHLFSAVKDDGSVSLKCIPSSPQPPDHSTHATELVDLFSAEYESQLSRMANPRESQKSIDLVYVFHSVVRLASKDFVVDYHFVNTDRITAVLKTPMSRIRPEITKIVQEILAFPEHENIIYYVDRLIHGADLNSYFRDKFCKINGVVHRILRAGHILEDKIALQAEKVASPTAQQMQAAFPSDKLGKIIDLTLDAAWQALKKSPLMQKARGETISHEAQPDAPLVKIMQLAIFQNLYRLTGQVLKAQPDDPSLSEAANQARFQQAAVAKLAPDTSSDKKDGT